VIITIHLGDQIWQDEMSRSCDVSDEDEKGLQCLAWKHKERDYLVDLGIRDGREDNLKWILKKLNARTQTGLI
jgi:hypothetical protein